MTMTISATEANRSFARLLRRVRDGERVRITSHGKVVAIIAPSMADEDGERERRVKAVDVLEQRWARQQPVTIGPWTREELYERDSWAKWQR